MKRDVKPYEWDSNWYCGDTSAHECQCRGTLWIGYTKAPDTGDRIESFDKLRQYKHAEKEVEDNWITCSPAGFGLEKDLWGEDVGKQCWCEPEPYKAPNKCADEGGECLCEGHVYFGQAYDDKSKPINYYDMMNNYWTINDANSSKSISCTPSSFEDVDPLEGEAKQCMCDNDRE